MRRVRRALMVLAAPAAILTSVALMAPAASAGTVPGVPSSSQMQGHRHNHFERQTFQLTLVTKIRHHKEIQLVNNVDAQGPVDETGGTDTENSGTAAVFDFGDGNTVNVLHTDVNNVQPDQTDLKACTQTAFATGSWLFDGGTGKYEKVFGFGRFKFILTLYFQQKHHGRDDGKGDSRHHHARCDFKHDPKLVVVKVFGFGKATNGHRHHHD